MLKALLTTYQLDTIFVVVQFANRGDTMIQNYEAAIDPLIKADAINRQIFEEKTTEIQGKLGHRINYEKNNPVPLCPAGHCIPLASKRRSRQAAQRFVYHSR